MEETGRVTHSIDGVRLTMTDTHRLWLDGYRLKLNRMFSGSTHDTGRLPRMSRTQRIAAELIASVHHSMNPFAGEPIRWSQLAIPLMSVDGPVQPHFTGHITMLRCVTTAWLAARFIDAPQPELVGLGFHLAELGANDIVSCPATWRDHGAGLTFGVPDASGVEAFRLVARRRHATYLDTADNGVRYINYVHGASGAGLG